MEMGRIVNVLESQKDEKQAAIHKNYHKSDLQFMGWTTPQMRQLASHLLQERSTPQSFFDLCDALWQQPIFETRMLVTILFEKRIKQFFQAADFERFYPLLRDCDGWALTDNLAIKGLGAFLFRFPRYHAHVDGWKTDSHLWVRRAGILRFITPVRYKADWPSRMEAILIHHFAETDFFIRKAIGWTLREWSKLDPDRVRHFAFQNKEAMSALTFKEATRKIKPSAS
ncbi:MAG: hypothetical protein GF313_04050 [Caldithrix sp.]|nr:hypothetical protein [Caldithrix sp.]